MSHEANAATVGFTELLSFIIHLYL